MAHFETPRFPDRISEGATGGPGYDTQVVTMVSGVEMRNQNWAVARLSWDVAYGLQDADDLKELISFFRTIGKGKANSFRFKDWADFTATHPEGLLGAVGQLGVFTLNTGVGSATRQLGKRYTAGASVEDRKITKIVAGSYTLYNPYPTVITEGGGAGQYTLDINTGIVTLGASLQASSTITATFQFDVPCRFDTDQMKVDIQTYNVYNWGQIPVVEVKV